MTQAPPTGLGWARLADVDPELWDAMVLERGRQHDKIELIASENYTFAAVMEAQGSWLTNKYAEGLPGKRYYGGCEYVDIAETLAQRARPGALPRRGARQRPAPLRRPGQHGRLLRVLQPGDRILGMNLAHGGHLTHGSPVNFSGRLYEVHAYGVDKETERIDYDALEAIAQRGPAEARRRRRLGLPADHRLPAHGRDRPRRRGAAVRRHGPHRRARRGRRPPEPVPARGHRHDDDAQDAARRRAAA